MTRDLVTAYDAWAETYDAIDNPLVAQATAALAARASWLSGARVLELGCGTGRNLAAALAGGATSVVGIDASPQMLSVARARFADEARVQLVEADLVSGANQLIGDGATQLIGDGANRLIGDGATQLIGDGANRLIGDGANRLIGDGANRLIGDGANRLIGDGARFDLVLVCLVLEHFADVAPIVDAAKRALDREGRLLVLELHADLHARGVGANFEVDGRELRLTSVAHNKDELVDIVARAGLRLLHAVDHVPSPAALMQSRKLARYVDHPVLLEVAAQKP